MNEVVCTQSVYASVAHRYWLPDLSVEENQRLYGSDASIHGLGSNLCLAVSARDASTDLDAALLWLKARVDHQNLITEHPSTLENIALDLARETFRRSGVWSALTLWQSESLFCTVFPDQALVELGMKLQNLTLIFRTLVDPQTGLAVVRREVAEGVRLALSALHLPPGSAHSSPSDLWQPLTQQFQSLCRIRVDISRHEYIVIES